MTDGKGFAPAISDHLPRLLTRARDQFLIDMRRHREERGLHPARPSQIKILALIPDDGANITELANRAGMTKQALGELVDGLEDGGYAVASRLKTDRRVRIVTRTQPEPSCWPPTSPLRQRSNRNGATSSASGATTP